MKASLASIKIPSRIDDTAIGIGLGAWVATNATVIDQPVRELYVVSVDESGALLPDADLRTEIAWPIEAP